MSNFLNKIDWKIVIWMAYIYMGVPFVILTLFVALSGGVSFIGLSGYSGFLALLIYPAWLFGLTLYYWWWPFAAFICALVINSQKNEYGKRIIFWLYTSLLFMAVCLNLLLPFVEYKTPGF